MAVRTVTTAAGLQQFAQSRAPGDEPEAAFRAGVDRLVAACPPGLVVEHRFFTLPANQAPWTDSGMDLAAGEHVTTFAVGKVWMSREAGIWMGPNLWAWFRLGEDGAIFRGKRASNSFAADPAGRLWLGGSFPGEWTDEQGALATPEAYASLEGGICICVIRWSGEALAGLREMAKAGDVGGLLACEIDRLETRVVVPDDWAYPWNVGTAEAFAVQEGFPQGSPIGCYTHDEVISLNKALDLPFLPGTRLAWRWKMDKLPSACREDFLHTHDYIAVAAYFDNVKDLAYYWSAELEPGTAYQCPIPKWTEMETHVVRRSGAQGLGEWFEEECDLYADYQRWIGAPPERLTGIWLIALSAFQHGEGQAEIADIRIIQGGVEIRVC
ncbi:MAG: hypothetical protein RIS17_1143, partial [Pseudomonadota bacterium]|jgi:hypothetical protein